MILHEEVSYPDNNEFFNNWVAFDLEWMLTDKDFHKIITFGYEDCYGNKRAIDVSDFATSDNPDKEFLSTIKDKLLRYDFCLAWASKSIEHKNKKTDKWDGVNGDLAVLDSNFRCCGIKSIVGYDKFTGIPFIKSPVGNMTVDIDLLKIFAKPLIRTLFKNKYSSLKLHDVANALLGYGKLENKSGVDIFKMSVKDRKQYCMWDSHILADLIRIQNGNVMKIMQTIANHTGLNLEQVCHKGMTGIWTKILNRSISRKVSLLGSGNIPSALRKLYFNHKQYSVNEEVIDTETEDYENRYDNEYEDFYYTDLPDFDRLNSDYAIKNEIGNQFYSKRSNKKYKGAIVLDPVRGLHSDVYLFDVTSLYPTMIIKYNLSPETVNCSCCRNDPKAKEVFRPEILNDCSHIPEKDKGYWICQRKRGLFAKILQQLTEERIRYKNAGLKIESQTIKALINSGYGVFGHPHFKYYDPSVVELVTAFGRQTLKKMVKISANFDFNVLYGDTDSLFVNNVKNQESSRNFIEVCRSELGISVGHEVTFSSLILVGKKHYIGICQGESKNDVVIKGMEGIKSDRPEFIRRTFRQLVEDFKNGVNPISHLRVAIRQLDRREVAPELLAISLPLRKNPDEYENDCIQKRLGLKLGLHRGDTLVYYKSELREEFYDALREIHSFKTIHESSNPKDISYEKYKDMLLRAVKDIIEILGYKIEDVVEMPEKLESNPETKNSDIKTIDVVRISSDNEDSILINREERRKRVREGIDLILSLFKRGENLFPRTIMTKRSYGQVLVNSRKEILHYFETTDFLDCRINAYPSYTEFKGIQRCPPNFIFIDLDSSTFESLEELNRSLSTTLDNIQNILKGFPTVLWTGNGYHIYQPVDSKVLEEKPFEEFENPSLKFLRFAEHYMTNWKSDPSHNPSLKSCLVRIPGSFNSKCKENNNEVKIIQKWDGYRPLVSPLLPSFYEYLVSEKIREIELQKKAHDIGNGENSTRIEWIERLLQTPIDDYRKNASSLILASYLVNIKKLSYNNAYITIRQWLTKCNDIRKLDFNVDYLVRCALNNSAKSGFKPMKFNTLRYRNRKLYDILNDCTRYSK